MTTVTKDNMAPMSIQHLETFDSTVQEKQTGSAYVADENVSSHHKSHAERRLVLKSDMLIVPLAGLVYFSAYLDRNSIGNAKIIGFATDLNISATGYYNCATMFYIGYIVFMLPGNICLRYFRPNMQLGGCVIIFGLLVTVMGVAQNYETVLALRILIGASQAFIQGLGLYVSLWYKRNELATRSAIYYSAATISGAFSGLIAYGCQANLSLEDTGRAPWRWLFIIEGIVAIFVGLLVWIFLPRFPDRMKNGKSWLFTEEEVEMAKVRSATYNTLGAKVELSQIWVTFKDPKSWAFAIINSGLGLGISSVGVFLPTFIVAFGYTAERAQLFSVIPYAFATVSLLVVCITSDRVNVKGPFLFLTLSTAAIGYILLLTESDVTVKMVAACLITSGLYPSVVLLVSWLGINTGGFTKRGTTWAMAEIFGQCFSIMGSNIYTDRPRYIKGHSIVLAFLVLGLVSTTSLYVGMRRCNKKKDALEAQYAARGELHPHALRSLEQEYDFHVSFRYIL